MESFSNDDWDDLIKRIGCGRITPFIGAGASTERLPTAAKLASEWSRKHDYPLKDCDVLSRVAQYIAVRHDNFRPKQDMAELCRRAQPPDFSDPAQIHRVLASLPISVYVTTNYDNFMVDALNYCRKKPRREVCRWNENINISSLKEEEPDYEPDQDNPLVFHLHGVADDPDSMVLTEDDYLDFMIWFSRNWQQAEKRISMLLPNYIINSLTRNSLLFVGYGQTDWDFRVLFRCLVSAQVQSMQKKSISVQLEPLTEEEESIRERAKAYLQQYYRSIGKVPMRVFWGKAHVFAGLLKTRWEARDRNG